MINVCIDLAETKSFYALKIRNVASHTAGNKTPGGTHSVYLTEGQITRMHMETQCGPNNFQRLNKKLMTMNSQSTEMPKGYIYRTQQYDTNCPTHDDVIKWKHFLRHWFFVRGIHRSLVISPHKGQWCGALMFSWICTWLNGSVNNGEAGDLRRGRFIMTSL